MSVKGTGVWERYSRQVLFAPIGKEGQQRLQESRVAVVGLGALGTVSANSLARAGVGFLRLVDRDFVEESNLQRQILFDEKDAAGFVPKASAAAEKLKLINSAVQYEALVEDINFTNILDIIDDVDLVLDATDNFETRFLLNEACVKKNISWIYGACVASLGITFTVIPGRTGCLACFMGSALPPGPVETCDTAGIINPVVNMVASLQAVEAIKLLTGATAKLRSKALYMDVWENEMREIDVVRKEGCPICGKQEFRYLTGRMQQRSTTLCGRQAVQVLPAVKQSFSLPKLREKLQPLGTVFANEFLLKFSVGEYQMIIFPDGRALIKGTTDEKIARALYARYIGS